LAGVLLHKKPEKARRGHDIQVGQVFVGKPYHEIILVANEREQPQLG
jgi:hypothetical protein